jgi:hypothetical protein
VIDGMTVPSLSASFRHKTKEAIDHANQIALNQKLLHRFKKWCKFSSRIKVKLQKKKLFSSNQDLPVFTNNHCLGDVFTSKVLSHHLLHASMFHTHSSHT